jgi:hypothetical protein
MPNKKGKHRMLRVIKYHVIFIIMVLYPGIHAQVTISDTFLIIKAEAHDPLFTTYAAPLERSHFFADKAYFLDYFNPSTPVTCSSQYAGEIALFWKVNNVLFKNKAEFAQRPVVLTSFPDMAVLEYQLIDGLKIQEVFQVYSSGSLLIDLYIYNTTHESLEVFVYPVFYLPGDSLHVTNYEPAHMGFFFTHHESLHRLHSDLYKNRGYPTRFINLLAVCPAPASFGIYQVLHRDEFQFIAKRKGSPTCSFTE